MKIIIAILIFGFIIFFHELGHFLVAKKCGVKVNEFCLGFGPRLFGIKRGETDYCLRLLPLGGACVMEGEDEDSDDERSFRKKALWKRALIVAAGPLFNFLLAYILSVIMIASAGIPAPVVDHFTKTGDEALVPAQIAGLEPGDEIIRFGNHDIHFFNEIPIYLFFHPGEAIETTYIRDGQEYKTVIQPEINPDTGRGVIGIVGEQENRYLNPLQVLQYSFYEVGHQIYVAAKSVGMLITGRVGIQDMSGPVGIVKVIGDTYESSMAGGAFVVMINLFSITILLSANLGVMNLIPIPALDGGRLLFMLIEGITRKKIPEKVETVVNVIGFVALMVLMVVVIFSDVIKIATGAM